MAGRTVAAGLARLGHDVVIGTRDPSATRARADWDSELPLRAYGDVADGADVVVNATNGQASLSALEAVGADRLAGKVVLDLANALDFSSGFPPRVAVDDSESLAERLQRAFPEARVVKALNTVNAAVMVNPGTVGEGDTTVFVASDDAEARAVVVGLLEQLGWRDVIEFDELSAARGLELWLPLWVRLMARLGTPDFNLKLVR
jgi:predicted dinucleotide-binding enzyme